MSWDPVLLRKYNTTGHFRLLNQLRNELRTSPINRPQASQPVASESGPRSLEVRPQAGGGGRSRRGGASADNGSGATSGSFRERLNAIEMR
jgi:hypothetical protein